MSHGEHVEVNRLNWDERVAGHLVAYDADGFAADPTRLSTVVRDDLALMAPHLPAGSIAGLSLLHLQCHIGTDTLSWARLGARVTGVDFSGAAIAAARELAGRAGLDAAFVHSTVDEAGDAVGERFDVVYTSIGALVWLPDLAAWARSIRSLLKPGGLFYVRDAHPMLTALDDQRDDELLVVRYPYFGTGGAQRFDEDFSYIGDARLRNTTTYQWPHPLSEIVGALLGAGLAIEGFGEQDTLPWRYLPWMVELTDSHGVPDGRWVLPEGRDRVPLTFSIAARG
ncbi:class I SAM-dependent methyltransferase [Gryllotalpicola ginsengisoli]|uniref:class I SAM-dependent methyltransferase n=1 Tax=Gryllotalpicola ginsengisoli TaxID=444608 RepID=UPI0003B48B7D|nr:class I SAM-dependent methyltransferase [Gryllotalpicola ginsengisoli]